MQIVDLKDAPQHLPTLAAWHQAQWSYLNPAGSLASRIEKMQAHLVDRLIPSTFIALDEELLGSAAIVASDMDTRPELSPWLASVFVAPAHRNKGIGAALVKQVVARAKQTGIETLYLFTPDREPFYQTLGWQTLYKEPYRGSEVTVMRIVTALPAR